MGRMGRMVRKAGWAGVVLLLAGCWPMAGQGPDRRAFNSLETVISTTSVGTLVEAWTFGPVNPPGDPSPPVWVGSPVVSEGVGGGVNVTIGACAVASVGRNDGQLQWLRSLSEIFNEPLPCSPYVTQAQTPTAVDPERLVIGRAHLLPDFTIQWLSQVVDPASGVVLSEDDGGLLHGLRGDQALFYSDMSHTQAAFAFRRVTVGSFSDPSARRTFTFDGQPAVGGTVDPNLTLGETLVFHAGPGPLSTDPTNTTRGMGLRAYPIAGAGPGCATTTPLEVECPLWVTPIDGTQPTEVVIGESGDVLYVGTGAGTLYALAAADGTVLWKAALGAAIEAPPAVAHGTLFVPTEDGRVVALPEAGCGDPTCMPLWQSAPTDGPIRVQPAVANDVVFVAHAGEDGKLQAFDATGCPTATCAPIWSTTTDSPITGAPAISNGYLYIGTQAGPPPRLHPQLASVSAGRTSRARRIDDVLNVRGGAGEMR